MNKVALITAVLAALYAVLRLIAFLTPENRKNLLSNVIEIKSVAISNRRHLFIAIIIFVVTTVFLVFYFLSNSESETINHSSMISMNLGDVVEFGGTAEKKIEWIVIEKNKHYLTLLSKNCLEAKSYHENFSREKRVTWENSTLRSWLNDEFIKNFSESEQSAMVEFRDGGFVSLLEKKQAKKLEKENGDLLVCYSESEERAEAKVKDWWLQTPKGDCVMFVNSLGKVQSSCTKYFDNRADKSLFVRPLIRKKI